MNWIAELEKIKLQLIAISNKLPMVEKTNSLKLHDVARAAINESLVKDDPRTGWDERDTGCVMALKIIVKRALGIELCQSDHTADLYRFLSASPNFVKIERPEKGCVVLNPTGFGNGKIRGHTGIWTKDGVMSNDSRKGLEGVWRLNYSHQYWIGWFEQAGGIPTYYFRVL